MFEFIETCPGNIDSKSALLEEGGGDRPLLPFRGQYGKRNVPGVRETGFRFGRFCPGGLGIKDNRPHGRPVSSAEELQKNSSRIAMVSALEAVCVCRTYICAVSRK